MTLVLAALTLCVAGPAAAQARRPANVQTVPTHANVSYGPHERNVMDVYLADAATPAPLVLYIHGGGFRGGDKRSLREADLQQFLGSGFSVAALNYRLTDVAPAPAAYLDCARALQVLRHRAKEWNLDPQRVASTGSSAGAGTSLWLAFHDDLRDPASDDPVSHQSTRLSCVAVSNGQSSYDPRFAEQIGIPRPNFERHVFFLPFYGITADEIDTPKAYARYEEMAPVTHLTADDPPVLMDYGYAPVPVDAQSDLGLVVHHPYLGIALKERMDRLGIECIVQHGATSGGGKVRHGDDQPVIPVVEFLRRHLVGRNSDRAE
jgi:acetyl esterase/lipase